MWIELIPINLERIRNHAEAAIRHNGALEGRFGLKADNDFVLAIDIARTVRGNGAWNLRDVEHTFLALFHKELVQPLPYLLGPLRCGRKKRLVPLIRLVVLLKTVTNIDLQSPSTSF